MNDYIGVLVSIVSPLVCGLLVAIFNQLTNRKWKEMEMKRKIAEEEARERAEERCKESKLMLDMIHASCKMSYANAMALKRGKPNGEVEEGIKLYKVSEAKYYDFLSDQTAKYLNKR